MKAEQYDFIASSLIALAGRGSDLLWHANKILLLSGILLSAVLILGIVIIINQIRIRKQLRRIQEQLDAASDKNNAGGDNQGK